MNPSIYDPCFLFTEGCMINASDSRSFSRGMVCPQTNDTSYVGNTAFMKLEAKNRNQFDSKNTMLLSRVKTCKYNGRTLQFYGTNYTMTQPNHIEMMSLLSPSNFAPDDFISERALGAYFLAVCFSEPSYAFSIFSQVMKPDEKT